MKLFSRESALTDSVRLIIFVILMSLVAIFLPVGELLRLIGKADDSLALILGACVRFIFSVLFIVMSFKFGFKLVGKQSARNLFILIPAIIIAVNNFPFITYFGGTAQISDSGYQIFAMVLFCVSVGFFEELAFRGLVLPLVYIKMQDKKYAIFWSICISSALFGAIHLVNLTSGFNPMVFLQIGYSFLIGALCGIVHIKTKNIAFPIIIHAAFDIAGKLCTGTYWIGASIALTAIVSVAVIISMIFFIKSLSKDSIKEIAGIENSSSEKSISEI